MQLKKTTSRVISIVLIMMLTLGFAPFVYAGADNTLDGSSNYSVNSGFTEEILPVLIAPFGIGMTVPVSTPFEQVDDWASLQAAIAGASGSIDIHVMTDITATGQAIVIPAGLIVYLRSNPESVNIYSIYQNATDAGTTGLYRHFRVEGTLYFDNIAITRNAALTTFGGGILVYETGHAEMFDGAVVSNNRATVFPAIPNPVLNPALAIPANGGTRGGGILNAGTFIMHGGRITNNISTHHGGGVFNAGTFIMDGGKISKNTAGAPLVGNSGGAGVSNMGQFFMNGGEISDNESIMLGGGVRSVGTDESTFHMTGHALIYNNVSPNVGSGVILQGHAVFHMSGNARVEANFGTAGTLGGGGVSVSQFGRFYMHDNATIYNNTSNNTSGGVHIAADAVFTMNDGLIDYNRAVNNGGGVRNGGGTMYMHGGVISRNIVENPTDGLGGGVIVASAATRAATFDMTGGIIEGNEATRGGGVYVQTGGQGHATFIMRLPELGEPGYGDVNHLEPMIYNNTAVNGGGVFNRALFTMEDGLIIGNRNPIATGTFAPAIFLTGNAEFNMSGGTVRGHHHPVNMFNAGTGIGNGNIFAQENAVLNMSGGIITENSASQGAPAINIAQNAQFNKSGGIITENVQRNIQFANGGWPIVFGIVTAFGNAVVTLTDDALITNNEVEDVAGRRGGSGLLLRGATGYMHDGEISYNWAHHGGGVSVGHDSTFTMTGGLIFGNVAHERGGGVLVGGVGGNNATFNMFGGVINNNHSLGVYGVDAIGRNVRGGGGGISVYPAPNNLLNMTGGLISSNTAAEHGGGVWNGGITVIRMPAFGEPGYGDINHLAPMISNNTATINGGGIFTVSYTSLTTSDEVIFRGNSAATAHNLWEHPDYPKTLVPAADSGGGTGGSIANIDWATVSIPGTHALNNFDINYIGHDIDILTFNPNGGIFASIGTAPQVRVIQHDGANPIFYSQAFDAANNLLNPALPHPTRAGYTFGGWFDTQANADGTTQTGRILHSDEITDTSTRILWARWTPQGGGNGGGGNGNGGNGNGTVEIPDPDVPLAEMSPDHHAYIIGYPDGTVRPNANITRAEVATIFFRLICDYYRIDIWSQENPFPDVQLHHWFNNAISTLTNANFLYGYPDGYFRPDQSMTRAEFAALIVRIMGERGAMATASNSFTDVSGHWGEAYISVAYELGWVRGYPDGTFRPNQFITRAEVAALVNRALGRLPEYPTDLLEGMVTWPDNMNVNAWYYLYMQEATNSHYHEMKDNGINETWTELITPREWWRLERPNSDPTIFTGLYIGEGMGMIEE